MSRKPIPNRSSEVEVFLSTLKHPFKDVAYEIRDIALDCLDGVTEQIKWKAPSFVYRGEDRITFNFSNQDSLRIVIHRGVKVKDATKFKFDDTSGLIEWRSKDRGLIEFSSPKEARQKLGKLRTIFKKWYLYTAEMDKN